MEIDKKLNLKTVSVLDEEGNVQIKMTFNKIDLSPKFNDDYFKLNTLLNNSQKEDDNNQELSDEKEKNGDTSDVPDTSSEEIKEETKETATLEDIIYPMYLPANTYLTTQEKIDTESGQRLILTFEGDNPFILVEETVVPSENSVIIQTSGELDFLTDVIGIVSEKSVNWVSNNIEYYVASNVLETSEIIEIAKSISVLPVSK